MPRVRLPIVFAAALLSLAASACRPKDAPKEPTDPKEPTVGFVPAAVTGGVGIAFVRRDQGRLRLN
jgi:hypothetical protein